MSLYGSNLEYGLHCLLNLVDPPVDRRPSSRDLAEFQGVSPSLVAKLFTRLEKAGLVASAEGVHGGYRLARAAEGITVLDVVDAVEGDKALFRCREIRANCALFEGAPPRWATGGVCEINTVMRRAETRMRETLAGVTLAEIAHSVAGKIPAGQSSKAADWFRARSDRRSHGRREAPASRIGGAER